MSLAYSGAIIAVGLAAFAQVMLAPLLGDRFPFVGYYLAVLLTARAGGIGPSLLATVLGSLVADDASVILRNPGLPALVAWNSNPLGLPVYFAVNLSIVLAIGSRRDREPIPIEHFRIAMECIGDGVIVTDRSGLIVMVNPVAEGLVGWTSSEASGLPLLEVLRLIEEETRAEVECPAAHAIRRGDVVSLLRPTLLLARDGTTRAIDDSASPIRDRAGAVCGVVVIFRDITEKRRSVRALEESDQRLRLAIEVAGIGNWTCELSNSRLTWSSDLEAMCGVSPGTFAGTFEAFLGMIHEEDRERVASAIRRTIDQGESHRIEYRFVNPDGRVRWVQDRGRRCCDRQGRPDRLIGVCVDITERKRAEQESREADLRKDEFLATLAHELRNPLAPVRTGLELLKYAEIAEPSIEPLRAMMDRQVEHLARLVEDLIDLSRITRGTIELRKRARGIASIIREAVEANRRLIEESGHTLEVRLSREDWQVEVDPTRMEQILSNLLGNAAKFTNPGGRIGIDVDREGDEIVIRVSDDGIGIDPEMRGRIFDTFLQVERRLDRSQGGLGIGLSLVKKLVELHGGTITAESEGLGLGSEFVVRLPAIFRQPEGPAPSSGSKQRGDPAELPRLRVLVVDDNQDAADLLARCLIRLMGQRVEVAYDGSRAIELAREFRPDVVLLDIGLPGMSGYEVAERLRHAPESGEALLIAVTGWGLEEDRRRSRAAGIDHHLVKPIEIETIRELLLKTRRSARTGLIDPRAGGVPED
ncbi:hybrid sensor histidine kinase/response regulator [Tundrisphaera lichenicola]|uniref:hybrid sensor histidine kinase/response regulator n=1 Tax=Tundrisphaera lichenicola TaxID=2029860 RepID=UPI003EBDA0CF